MNNIAPCTFTQVTCAMSMLPPGPAMLFAAIASMTKEGKERVYPSVATLGHRIGRSRRQVFRYLAYLKDNGWIWVERRRKSKRLNRSSIYSLVTAKIKRAVTLSWMRRKVLKDKEIAAWEMRKRVRPLLGSIGDIIDMEQRLKLNKEEVEYPFNVACQSETYRRLMQDGLRKKEEGSTTYQKLMRQGLHKRE